jgi:hypothetical protein
VVVCQEEEVSSVRHTKNDARDDALTSFAFGEELRFGGLMIGRLIRGRRSLDGVLGVI